MELVSYICPNCMGAVKYNSSTGQFQCEYCDSTFTLNDLEEYEKELKNAQQESQQTENTSDFQWKQDQKGEEISGEMYVCEQCGAQIVTDFNTAAGECPYCNNPIMVKKNLSGLYRPDCVIPFAVDKKQAVEALKAFYKHKPLLPKAFTKDNRIDKIQGIYVPFFLYDCNAEASAQFKAEKVFTWEDKNNRYIETKTYHISRNGQMAFERIPADGSSKMADPFMDALEPYDYTQLTDFRGAYLSGFCADKYDVDAKQNESRINNRVQNSIVEQLQNTINGYQSVQLTHSDVRVKNGKVRYALLPVWILNTTYHGQTYTFAMNGQTGKTVGKLPSSKGKAAAFFGLIAAGIAAVGQALVFLL